MKQITALLLALLLTLTCLSGCHNPQSGDVTTPQTTDVTTTEQATTTGDPAGDSGDDPSSPSEDGCRLNGILLEEYTIVYAASDPEYTQNAATYLGEQIAERTGVNLTVTDDATHPEPFAHEIVVGETTREISAALDVEREGFEFAIMADEAHVALEGDYFVIAAAAYYFVETYVTGDSFAVTVASEATVHTPMTREAKNLIFVIGDGMGESHTRLFDTFTLADVGMEGDGEDEFYGYRFPYLGYSRTDSLSGTTDSAAGGTALSAGYKTYNKYIGKDKDLNDVRSLTEIAIELGKATAVMSTEISTGATPATFSVHAEDREDASEILLAQYALTAEHGTVIKGGYGTSYAKNNLRSLKKDVRSILAELATDEDGFFIMYEEAFIDKHSHANDLDKTCRAMVRLNQVLGVFLEFAFYHPDTVILMTADHETGGLTLGEDGQYAYTSEEHTSADVPVFAYGHSAEVFHGVTVENIQIPKTLAAMWGYELIGYDNEHFPSLIDVNVDE